MYDISTCVYSACSVALVANAHSQMDATKLSGLPAIYSLTAWTYHVVRPQVSDSTGSPAMTKVSFVVLLPRRNPLPASQTLVSAWWFQVARNISRGSSSQTGASRQVETFTAKHHFWGRRSLHEPFSSFPSSPVPTSLGDVKPSI